MNRHFVRIALLFIILTGCIHAADKKPKEGSPADHLPLHIKQLTSFGEQPEWRQDGRRVLFLGKVFGDVYEYELTTGRIIPCTDHFKHCGFTSAKYLSNGDILLSGPKEEFDRLDPAARQHAREVCLLSVLDKKLTKPPVPLKATCQEMPAVSRKQLRIAWTHGSENTRQDRIDTGDIVYKDGVPELTNVKQVLQVSDFPEKDRPKAWIETQNFVAPDDKQLTITAYEMNGSADTEVYLFDLEKHELKNVSKSPDTYDEVEGIFPDGKFTLVERSPHQGNHWPLNDLYKLALDGTGKVERLTYFTDFLNYKGTQGVISEDGKWMVFQLGKKESESGQGFGFFLYDLDRAKTTALDGTKEATAESHILRTKSVLFSMDFDDMNPLPELRGETAKGSATTVYASWHPSIGTIHEENTSKRTGALRLQVNARPNAKEWSASMTTGGISLKNDESNLAKLTLSFDMSASMARSVVVRLESLGKDKKRTGGLETLIYPASPNDFQRYAIDLSNMKAVGGGKFDPLSPLVSLTFEIRSTQGWPSCAGHELRVDNLCFAKPAFYVSPTGDDKNDGLSVEKPLATLSKALFRAQPGDIVLLMDGTFADKWCLMDFKSGGSPAAWVTVKNHPGQRPVLQSQDWNAVKIGKGNKERPSSDPALAYIELRGLVVQGLAEEVEAKYKEEIGKSVSITNGNGISVDGRFMTNKPHHIRLADNEILQCCGGGISVIHGDYVQIENNHAHHNCHWMIYAGSGISVYQPFNFDTTIGGHHILVRSNHSHHNYCTQPWAATGKLSDGNGIIVDDTQNHQNNSPNGPYRGGLLVQGNLSHDNGGSGIHSYASDNVDFINNTVCNNNTVMDYGQLSVTQCGNVRVLNNILVAPQDKPLNRVNGAFHDVFVSHNLFWGGNGQSVPGESPLTADPVFQNASKDDFHLGKKSPARKAGGSWEITPLVDLEGAPRAQNTIDLGALAAP